MIKRRKISEKEKEFIKENYPIYGLSYCNKELGINKNTILAIVKRLNIKFVNKYVSIINDNKELLQSLFDTSSTLREILKKLNLVARGGNYKTLNRVIEEENIDLTIFNENNKRWKTDKVKGLRNKMPLEKVLIEDSTYTSTTTLKNRLYKEGYKERICEKCGQSEEWMGKKMSLILDHVNGVNNDNRLENLRILCPNCNATLDTHCKGHKGLIKKEKKIPYLNKKKLYFNKYNHLYEEMVNDVKNMGYVKSAIKYDISDNGLRKRLKQLEEYRKIFL